MMIRMKKIALGTLILLVVGCSTDNVLTTEQQLKKDMGIIDKYLNKNGITPTIVDASGMRIVVEEVGTGAFPSLSSKLTVRYTGKFLSNGAVFDKSQVNSSGSPIPFGTPLSGLIKGWQIGFGFVAKGGKATFYIPSGLAYGVDGSQGIPGNSNLIFEVELIGFTN